MSQYKFTFALALAEKFLWEVFLTKKWDHVFRNKNPEHQILDFPVLPRELSFCPTERFCMEFNQRSREGDGFESARMIQYKDRELGASVYVFMGQDVPGKTTLWSPYLITFDRLPILDKKIVDRIGYSGISATDIPIWEK